MLHLQMPGTRVVVAAHRRAVEVQEEQLVVRDALHFEVKAPAAQDIAFPLL